MGDLSAKAKLKSLEQELGELLPQGVDAFIFVKYSDNLPLTQLWRNSSKKSSLSGDSQRLLGICAKRQRSVLVHDAEKDINLKGIKVRSFSSALCVPILDENKVFLGSVLVLAQENNALGKDHRFALERLSRDIAPILAQSRKLPEQKEEKSREGGFGYLFSRTALVVLCSILVFVGIWAAAPTPAPKQETKLAPVESQVDAAAEKSEEFLRTLQAGDYANAWQDLAPELRAEWSLSRFEQAMQDWAQTGDFAEVLKKRKISKVQRHLDEARVNILESELRGDRGVWDWKLQQRDEEWVVTSMRGPINSPAIAKKS